MDTPRRIASLVTSALIGASLAIMPLATSPVEAAAAAPAQHVKHNTTNHSVARNPATATPQPDAQATEEDAGDAYLALTDQHGQPVAQPGRPAPSPGAAPAAIVPNAPPVLSAINFNGINETQSGSFPPDNDLSVGPSHVLQVTNFAVSIYNKSGGLLMRTNFATFFGSGSEFVFDPRTFYDPFRDRFIVLADGQQGSGATAQSFFWIAITQTGNPTGAYFIYHFAITGPGDFLDFPELGMDRNSILVTVNDFKADGTFDAFVFALPKTPMYSGAGTNFFFFGGNLCTVAPPYVLDTNPATFFLMACPNASTVDLKVMRNSGTPNTTTYGLQATISVGAYSTPPLAPQAGIDYPLETGANQFANRSIQYSDRIWNVHTINVGGFATPRWYELSTSANSLLASGIWFAAGTSSDWWPHLTANASGEVFGTWMSNQVSPAVHLQVRFIGEQGGLSAGSGSGTAIFTSSQALTGQTFPAGRNRTGDYAAAALDPLAVVGCAANRRAYVVGETTSAANVWGSRIARVGFC